MGAGLGSSCPEWKQTPTPNQTQIEIPGGTGGPKLPQARLGQGGRGQTVNSGLQAPQGACGSQACAEQPSLGDPGRWNFYPVSQQPASAGEQLQAWVFVCLTNLHRGLAVSQQPPENEVGEGPGQPQSFQSSNMKAMGTLNGW